MKDFINFHSKVVATLMPPFLLTSEIFFNHMTKLHTHTLVAYDFREVHPTYNQYKTYFLQNF